MWKTLGRALMLAALLRGVPLGHALAQEAAGGNVFAPLGRTLTCARDTVSSRVATYTFTDGTPDRIVVLARDTLGDVFGLTSVRHVRTTDSLLTWHAQVVRHADGRLEGVVYVAHAYLPPGMTAATEAKQAPMAHSRLFEPELERAKQLALALWDVRCPAMTGPSPPRP